jgi:hypothetical protein
MHDLFFLFDIFPINQAVFVAAVTQYNLSENLLAPDPFGMLNLLYCYKL